MLPWWKTVVSGYSTSIIKCSGWLLGYLSKREHQSFSDILVTLKTSWIGFHCMFSSSTVCQTKKVWSLKEEKAPNKQHTSCINVCWLPFLFFLFWFTLSPPLWVCILFPIPSFSVYMHLLFICLLYFKEYIKKIRDGWNLMFYLEIGISARWPTATKSSS